MELGLRGKKAIVTGATRGIGRAIADQLAAEGCDVAICARTQEEVDEAVHGIAKLGVNCWGEAVNVRDGDAYKAFLEKAATQLGGCDVFVPNVSAGGGMERLWDVLLASGINPAADGWTILSEATALSADGNTIVGFGTRNGNTEAFVAIVPEPVALSLCALGGPALVRRRSPTRR